MESFTTKWCFGKCERCVWMLNGGCSEWDWDSFKEVADELNRTQT